jgi:hypothetical protein
MICARCHQLAVFLQAFLTALLRKPECGKASARLGRDKATAPPKPSNDSSPGSVWVLLATGTIKSEVTMTSMRSRAAVACADYIVT